MKKVIMMILTIATTLTIMAGIGIIPVSAAQSKTDVQIVKELTKNKQIKLVHGNSKKVDYIVLHRKNKKYIVVEKVVSYSKGSYGYTKDGYYIRYNKKVKKGKMVVSYLIYNPKTNYCDDVIYVVDNNMYR